MTNEELEEQGLVEVCSHCGSLHITVEDDDLHYCNTCGTVDFTQTITEEEYESRTKINC